MSPQTEKLAFIAGGARVAQPAGVQWPQGPAPFSEKEENPQ
jgi:hypothetical protein